MTAEDQYLDVPTLTDRLEAAERAIAERYERRVRHKKGMNYAQFRDDVRAHMPDLPHGRNAREFEWNVGLTVGYGKTTAKAWSRFGTDRFRVPVPEAREALANAIAWLIEATRHAVNGQNDSAWGALLQCYFWLGSAGGPNTAAEHSANGGETQGKPFDAFNNELRPLLAEWLEALPENGFRGRSEVIEAIEPKAKAFRDEWSARQTGSTRGRTQNFASLITKWSAASEKTSDPRIRAAVDRVIDGGLTKGAPKGRRPASSQTGTRSGQKKPSPSKSAKKA